MSYFEDAILSLESLGFLDVILPFLLIFTISFAVLQKSKILGERAKNFNTLVSFVLAMAAIIPHVIGRDPDVVVIINAALPNVSVLMVASLMVLLLIGVFGSEVNVLGTPLEGIVVLFAAIAVGYTFLASAGVVQNIPFLNDPETQSLLIAILVFGIIVWFITKEDEPLNERKSVRETLENTFGGWLGGKKH
jgi:hypothetical protein